MDKPTTLRSRHLLVALVAASIAVGVWLWWRGSASDAWRFPRANLLLVSVDTLRADALGSFGGRPGLTPSLDTLAAESVTFPQATAAANHTAPSHATMLTGMSPDVHGVVNTLRSTPRAIPSSIRTLAERLRDAGWRTAGDTDGGYMHRVFGFDRGFETFRDAATGAQTKVARCLEFFDGLASGERGFFFLHTYDVHGPYRVASEQAEEIFRRYPSSKIPARYRAIQRASPDRLAGASHDLFDRADTFTRVDAACLLDLYRTAVANLDGRIGALVDGLRARGRLDDTLIVFTSDHGEEFFEHGSFQHEAIHDEVMRVPLLVRFPKAALAGAKIAESFGSVHLTPTLLDLLGVEAGGMEGRSQRVGIFSGTVDEHASVAFASHTKFEGVVGHAARTPKAKILASEAAVENRVRAYDLEADPAEQRPKNVDEIPGAAALMHRLKGETAVWHALIRHNTESAPSMEMSEELLNELRSLGYAR